MYFQLEVKTKPTATVWPTETFHHLDRAIERILPDVVADRVSASIYKIPDGYRPTERILIARFDWVGMGEI